MKKSRDEHSKMGPSGYDRWSVCLGSLILSDYAKTNESSVYADEGSAAHFIREKCLKEGLDAWDFLFETVEYGGRFFEVDEDWCRSIQPGIDWLRSFKGKIYPERRVSIEPYLTGQFGTLDSAVICEDFIIVSDFKFGKGIPVDVYQNGQLMCYALAFWHHYVRKQHPHINKIWLNIDQPRVSNPNIKKDWKISLDTLKAFGKHLKKLDREVQEIKETIEGEGGMDCLDLYLKPSPKACSFCDAKGFCKAYADRCYNLLHMHEGKLVDPYALTINERKEVYENELFIRKWLNGVKDSLLREVLAGVELPGFKAIEGPAGDSFWTDSKKAERVLSENLGDRAFKPRHLITPVQALAMLPKEVAKELDGTYSRKMGSPRLVTEDVPGVPVEPAFEDMDVDEG